MLREFYGIKNKEFRFEKDTKIKRKLVEFFSKIQCDMTKFVQNKNNTGKCILNNKPYPPRGVMLAPFTVRNTGRRLTEALERA